MSGGAVKRRISTGADQPYWDALAEGRLEMPRCAGCGRWQWPAVWRCGECGSWEQTWHELPLRGEVYTWTRTWHPFGGAEDIGVPFVSLVVRLPQAGDRRLVGILEGDSAGLSIGAAVTGSVSATRVWNDDIPAIRWRLDRGGAQ
jgi:uncharacterized OB-fold protein